MLWKRAKITIIQFDNYILKEWGQKSFHKEIETQENNTPLNSKIDTLYINVSVCKAMLKRLAFRSVSLKYNRNGSVNMVGVTMRWSSYESEWHRVTGRAPKNSAQGEMLSKRISPVISYREEERIWLSWHHDI